MSGSHTASTHCIAKLSTIADMATTAPYGSWISPLSARDLAADERPINGGQLAAEAVWWSELRPVEGGRYAVCRRNENGTVVDVLPKPWNARTRVHEYGGGAWTATPDDVLIFAEFSDQRLYRIRAGEAQPQPLTPEPDAVAAERYAELAVQREGEVWCVRESHAADGAITRDIVAVPLDGSAADNPDAIRSVVGGSHFLAFPRLSPDGRRLAWIAWDHPQMPWDGTELRIADLAADGTCGEPRTLIGSSTESVLQPEWTSDTHLYVISDRSGWWNLYWLDASVPGEPEPLYPMEADFAGPPWMLGACWYAVLPDGRLLTVRTHGTDRLGVLDPRGGTLTDVDLGDLTELQLAGVSGSSVALVSVGPRSVQGLRLLDLSTADLEVIRESIGVLPDARYLPETRSVTFSGPGGRDVHAIVYPPRNPDFQAPEGELPPYVAYVHGGPTSHVLPVLDLTIAYFTSRGIGVVNVNYGGSTGYGREYRERLRGQWGVVDVEDTVAAVVGLVDAGLADRDRLAIEGGSAGGWTVLAALTCTNVFACGASYYGVADAMLLAENTHDFESRYLDGLIGPLPQARALYEQRAPLGNVDGLSCPVLLLQGLDDSVVPPEQAELFRDAMLAKGIPHAYLAYAGESHGFRRAETLIHSREAELSFYGQILGFEPPGVPRLQLWRPASD